MPRGKFLQQKAEDQDRQTLLKWLELVTGAFSKVIDQLQQAHPSPPNG
jgi:hypothetical protein